MVRARALLFCVVLALGGGAVAAQESGAAGDRPMILAQLDPVDPQAAFPTGTPVPSPPTVLVVNLERVFSESLFGQRVRADLGVAQAALIEENNRIQTDLQAEERSLAQRRATMEPAAFRAEADAFDARVQDIRREQDAKEVALQQVVDAGRTEFRTVVEPVVARLMVDRGATVVLYHTSVYVAVASVDITDESIAALDAAVGDGAGGDDGGTGPEDPAAP